jgi:hypothetical protein
MAGGGDFCHCCGGQKQSIDPSSPISRNGPMNGGGGVGRKEIQNKSNFCSINRMKNSTKRVAKKALECSNWRKNNSLHCLAISVFFAPKSKRRYLSQILFFLINLFEFKIAGIIG